jgi:hypothetical protein
MLTPIGDSNVCNIWDKIYHVKNSQVRKLSALEDKEGKTRTIGIFDYWSQTVLKPLHDSLMGGLKRIRNDCTFNQGSFRNNLPSEGPYFSIDLKDATDRFPISLQKRILSIATSKEYAESWASIMVDESFNFQGEKLSYGQGQPMGAYSSFPMFALSHHVVLRISGKRAGMPNYKEYSLLGDDVVLTCHDVVKQYKQILSNLKVSISIQKSYEGNLIEFAKRYIYNGNEVSGFQVGGLLET